MTSTKNYWAYRIGNMGSLYRSGRQVKLVNEIKDGRLRQGSGWVPEQDLKMLEANREKLGSREYQEARRNLPMLKVREGDLVLVKIDWQKIAIVEASEDWSLDKGYSFEELEGDDDYRHCFPVEYKREFHWNSAAVHGDIRTTFRCQKRFWNIYRYAGHVDKILRADGKDLEEPKEGEDKLDYAINTEFQKLFNDEKLAEFLGKVQGYYQGYEWEECLKFGIEKLMRASDGFRVELTSNKKEGKHGADLLIFIPNPIDEEREYVIVVQIKDHKDVINNAAIDQIDKATYTDYFDEGTTVIEKMVLITGAEKEVNTDVADYAEKEGVKILFKESFNNLLARIASSYINLKDKE